jgi:hypothetical protein
LDWEAGESEAMDAIACSAISEVDENRSLSWLSPPQ